LISDVIGWLFIVGSFCAVVIFVRDGFNRQSDQEKANYIQYKMERDRDFQAFTDKTIVLLNSNLAAIRNRQDSMSMRLEEALSRQNQAVKESATTINEAAQTVKSTPKVVETHTVEHHTEVISDSELRRREKIKGQWDKYRQDKAEWDKKYGKKRAAPAKE
jgi:glutamate/tyrosine decarboxylase-like PLP-dependent enzyme